LAKTKVDMAKSFSLNDGFIFQQDIFFGGVFIVGFDDAPASPLPGKNDEQD
jgi:hypothetical protein